MTREVPNLEAIKDALTDDAESLLVSLFGDPTSRKSRDWRWGSKGSISYRFRGKQSIFRNFETDESGGLLDAIMCANGCSFPAAVKWARDWLGLEGDKPTPIRKREPRKHYDADAEQQRAIAEAVAMWRAGLGITGTAAARYLQGRAIEGWPFDCVRIIAARDVARIATAPSSIGPQGHRKGWTWWRWPALMLPLTNNAGDVTAVQLIALTDQGEAVKHWEHSGKLKMVRGHGVGSALRLPGDATGPLVVAEGGETALSIWLATGHETWATVGSIGRAPIEGQPKGRAIVAARDDDPPRAPARKALRARLAGWRAAGLRVVEAQPWALSRANKSDFNDTLQTDGPDAVRDRIDAALRPQETTQGTNKADASFRLSTAIGRAVSDCLAWSPDGETPAPFKVIRATLGLGKSQVALEAAIGAIEAGQRVIYSAPTHDLAAELAERAKALAIKRGRSISVRVWHGRERDDPTAPGQTMCRDLQAAELARQANIDVLETVCNAPCQYRDGCSYLAQREARADLWLVPHALLFAALPVAMAGAALLVVDEGFALSGMMGLDGAKLLVPLKSLTDHATHGNGRADASADLDATLRPLRRQLLEAIAEHPTSKHGEPLQRAPLVAAGLTVEAAGDARKAEARRRRDVPAIAATTRADLLRELRAIVATNVAAKRAAMLWGHIEDLLADDGAQAAGRVELVAGDDGEKAFRLYGLATMGKGWRDLPTLHLDATADMALIRARVPAAELAANVEASEPHVAVHQVIGRAFGKQALEFGTAAEDARRFALATAAEHGGRWLVVASKGAADEWRETMPANVEVAHWGDLRGLDSYNDVRGVVCVGRWGVPPNVVGRIGAILTGRAIALIDGWYPSQAITLTAEDGGARTVDADRHPDATAEAVRAALVEAELVQAIGRGRGVRRHAGDPLAVYVLGNVPLPVPLASISDWQPVDCNRAMMADLGGWLQSAGDAAEATGRTLKAVKRQREHGRSRMAPCPYIKYLSGHGAYLPDGLAVATYQRRGAGRSETRIIYNPDRIPDARAWLESKLGPLVHFEADRLAVAAPIEAAAPMVAPVAANSEGTATLPAMDIVVTAEFSGDVADATADPWADYDGGIMPPDLAAFVRTMQRAGGITQERLAIRMDLSRPQLANALAGRFGLSRDAAVRLRSTLAELPQAQASLL